MWQKARFLPPTDSPEPFYVRVERPTFHKFPELNDAHDGFNDELFEGLWYRTNVVAVQGFYLWAPHEGIELLPEFIEDDQLEPDWRFKK